MIRVILETPFSGARWEDPDDRKLAYLRACMHDCLSRGEAPYASHGLYTQPGVLDDNDPFQRQMGIQAGFDWREAAKKTVVYTDLGTSDGMRAGIEHARKIEQPVEFRKLRDWNKALQPSEEQRAKLREAATAFQERHAARFESARERREDAEQNWTERPAGLTPRAKPMMKMAEDGFTILVGWGTSGEWDAFNTQMRASAAQEAADCYAQKLAEYYADAPSHPPLRESQEQGEST